MTQEIAEVETPTNATARRDAEIRDVRDKYWATWQSLTADMNAEIREIERRYAFERGA